MPPRSLFIAASWALLGNDGGGGGCSGMAVARLVCLLLNFALSFLYLQVSISYPQK